ncbi:DUF485 domain-containing protein [Leucobacter massiliensis]|uniref:Clumping factor B n=1 Tax=Leucobacter massiliensis TaxID=1686285 RepID=A0A2S9QM28_9MICO|nr:DUF485 domain-containing protein [Leucobacter massiliensis]PRI10637.1 hypothetical protein B4915_06930 [Leucobacter massiliensis]
MSSDPNTLDEHPSIDYEAFQAKPEFQEMKRDFRRFVFPLTVAFMLWFLLFVVLGTYAHALYAVPFLGLNVGLWLGIAQFVTTFAITTWYVSWANKHHDPRITALRAELETLEAAGTGSRSDDAEGGAR